MSDHQLMSILGFDPDDLDANRSGSLSPRQQEAFPAPPPGCAGRWAWRLFIGFLIAGAATAGVTQMNLPSMMGVPRTFTPFLASGVTFLVMFPLMLLLTSLADNDETKTTGHRIAHTDPKMRLFSEGGVTQARFGGTHIDITPHQFEALTAYRKLNRDQLYRVYHIKRENTFMSLEVITRAGELSAETS